MSARTPGPWRWEVAPDGEDGDCILVAGDFTEIILATGVDGTPADDDLIAAAPDLLAALQRLIASHDAHYTLHAEDGDDAARMVEWAAAEDEARAAIAKATGEAA